MDYDIFITTRIREEAQKGRETNDAIIHAMRNTGGVITVCGIIMAGAFGTLLLSQGSLLREFGFALMFAILLEATIVRIYLVPAIVSLLGNGIGGHRGACRGSVGKRSFVGAMRKGRNEEALFYSIWPQERDILTSGYNLLVLVPLL